MARFQKWRRFVLLVLPVLISSCDGGGEASLEITNAWVRPMALQEGEGPGANSAAYFTLRNTGRAPDTLLGGEAPVARAVEVHETRMEGDVMRMREVGALEVPARQQLQLEPGGLHIMLLGLREALVVGDTVTLVLDFRRSGPVTLRIPVLPSGFTGR